MDKTVVIWLVVGVLILILTILIFAFFWVRRSYAKKDTARFLAAANIPEGRPHTKEEVAKSEAMQGFYRNVHEFGKQKFTHDPSSLYDEHPVLGKNMGRILNSYEQAHGGDYDPELYLKHLRNFEKHIPAEHYKVLSTTLADLFKPE